MGNRFVIAALTLCLCACSKSGSSPPAPTNTGTLAVSPGTVELMANQKQCFTVSGGGGNYTWVLTLDEGRQGILTTPQTAQACFQSPVYTQFVITVQAADGELATASGVVME